MKSKQVKKKILEDLKSKFSQANGYILVNLLNLKAQDQKKARDFFKKNEAIFQVTKKTLIYKAKPDFPLEEDKLKFPLAFIWNFDDSISAFRVLNNLKKIGINLNVFSGFLNGRVLDKNEVWQLSQLPSREDLIQKLTGILKFQLSRFVYDLKSPLQKLTYILSQIKDKK